MSQPITRRTMLRGLGTALALPALDIMAPAAGAAPAAGPANRVAFLYVPNGMHMPDWKPAEVGRLRELPRTLKALVPFKGRVNLLSGLTLDKARSNGDGGGDHARAMAAFLTGVQPRKTNGADIHLGVSADQYLAKRIGDRTRFPSLELGIEAGRRAGNCDSGYSCAYQSTISWVSATTPNAKEVDPALVFDRLFAGDDPKELAASRAKRELFNKSLLDFVSDDAARLQKQLGTGDKRKLDEYLTGVREIELRIERVKRERETKPTFEPKMPRPGGTPRELKEHIRLMCDLSVLAFRADLTRVVTLPFANEGSNRPYPFLGVRNGHHSLSHHGNDPRKQRQIAAINRFHAEQLAYYVGELAKTREGGKSLLDETTVVYGGGVADGNRHHHHDLPIAVIGGPLRGGRHLAYPKETPLMNLYLALFDMMGVGTNRFGDSTGKLSL